MIPAITGNMFNPVNAVTNLSSVYLSSMESIAYSSLDKVSSYMSNSSEQEDKIRIEMAEKQRSLDDRQKMLDKREKMLDEKDIMNGNCNKISKITNPTYLRQAIL